MSQVIRVVNPLIRFFISNLCLLWCRSAPRLQRLVSCLGLLFHAGPVEHRGSTAASRQFFVAGCVSGFQPGALFGQKSITFAACSGCGFDLCPQPVEFAISDLPLFFGAEIGVKLGLTAATGLSCGRAGQDGKNKKVNWLHGKIPRSKRDNTMNPIRRSKAVSDAY
nr:hypothetical protein [Ruegeria sp. AD91A]